MISVCIPYTHDGHEQNNWDYLLSNFKPDQIFIIGKPEQEQELPATNVYGKGVFINSYSQLPNDKIVLLAPQLGTYIKGDENIINFIHPLNAVYVVGCNHIIITEEDFDGKLIDNKVYIEVDTKDEMFNWTAMTVALYDRKIKNG